MILARERLTQEDAKRLVTMPDRSRIPILETLTPFEREVAFHAVIVALAGLNEPRRAEVAQCQS